MVLLGRSLTASQMWSAKVAALWLAKELPSGSFAQAAAPRAAQRNHSANGKNNSLQSGSEMTLSWRGKRVLDIVVSVLAAPAVLVISVIAVIVIYITMGRPILFTQKRVGLGGRTFDIYKLRTMVAADGGACTTQRQDPRVTPLGALLRKFRIDELPQFINVLKGDMSLIGPRPEQPRLVEDYCRCIPRFAERHRVKPGITGLAQVRYQYASDAAETRNKLRYDLIYVRRQSVVLDLWILLCTTGVILKGFGAR